MYRSADAVRTYLNRILNADLMLLSFSEILLLLSEISLIKAPYPLALKYVTSP